MHDLIADLRKLRTVFSREDKLKFIALLILMLIGAILEAMGIAAIPVFVSSIVRPSSLTEIPWLGQWFSGLSDEPSATLIIWTGSLIFGFVFLKNIFLSYIQYVQASIVTSQRLKLGDKLFRAYLSAPYEWHLRRNSSELMRNLETDTAQLINGMIQQFLTLVMSLLMVSLIVVVMLLSTPASAFWAMLITGAGLFTVIRVLRNRLQQLGELKRSAVKGIFKAIQQGFGGLIYAKITGSEEYLGQKHRESLAQFCNGERQIIVVHKLMPYAMETIVFFGLIVVLILLLQTTESLSDVLPLLSLLAFATIRLKQMATQIAYAINQMNVARASIPNIVDDLEELHAIQEKQGSKPVQGGVNDTDTFRSLNLESVEYAYPGIDDKALQSVSLELKRGESIAFVGPTGSGKSTLLNLILGLLNPQSGCVRVNGVHTIETSADWSGLLGYIPQSIYLVDDTIRSNIAFGVAEKDVDEARLNSALRTASLEGFINSLPGGINTLVGERGVRLSGGQQQRLGIARALYRNPEVLVMDEASSSLDNKTEQDVMKAIQNLKRDRTLIVVAHRLNTVKECDRLYFLNKGKIECTGTYQELLSESSAFREMVASI